MRNLFIKINKLFTVTEISFFLILSLLACPAIVLSEEIQPVDNVIEKLQRSYDQIKDLRADFIQETTIRAMKKTQRESGEVFFKNPKNML